MKIIKIILITSFIISNTLTLTTEKLKKTNIISNNSNSNNLNTIQNSNKQEEIKNLNKNQESSFLQVQEQISSSLSSSATATSTVENKSTLESTSTAKLGLREKAAKAVEDAEKIAQQFKKEIEEYAKIKKERKPVKVDNMEEESELEFIQKNSMSKYLPEDINQKLNEFRLE